MNWLDALCAFDCHKHTNWFANVLKSIAREKVKMNWRWIVPSNGWTIVSEKERSKMQICCLFTMKKSLIEFKFVSEFLVKYWNMLLSCLVSTGWRALCVPFRGVRSSKKNQWFLLGPTCSHVKATQKALAVLKSFQGPYRKSVNSNTLNNCCFRTVVLSHPIWFSLIDRSQSQSTPKRGKRALNRLPATNQWMSELYSLTHSLSTHLCLARQEKLVLVLGSLTPFSLEQKTTKRERERFLEQQVVSKGGRSR